MLASYLAIISVAHRHKLSEYMGYLLTRCKHLPRSCGRCESQLYRRHTYLLSSESQGRKHTWLRAIVTFHSIEPLILFVALFLLIAHTSPVYYLYMSALVTDPTTFL